LCEIGNFRHVQFADGQHVVTLAGGRAEILEHMQNYFHPKINSSYEFAKNIPMRNSNS
jgi:hypothetical protein